MLFLYGHGVLHYSNKNDLEEKWSMLQNGVKKFRSTEVISRERKFELRITRPYFLPSCLNFGMMIKVIFVSK
jgi:hypothetical protein